MGLAPPSRRGGFDLDGAEVPDVGPRGQGCDRPFDELKAAGIDRPPSGGRGARRAAVDDGVDLADRQRHRAAVSGLSGPDRGGTTHQQTFTVTSDNPGVKATIAQGQFLTVGVTHTASSTAGDVTVNGTMTFQLFQDFTPNTVAEITSLVNGTAGNLATGVSIGSDYYVGKVIHRIASGFPTPTTYIVQGGSLNGDGTGNVFATPVRRRVRPVRRLHRHRPARAGELGGRHQRLAVLRHHRLAAATSATTTRSSARSSPARTSSPS